MKRSNLKMISASPKQLTIALIALASSLSHSFADEQADAERHFTLKVLPTLSEKCYGCHGEPG
jgi:hypothetical protein